MDFWFAISAGLLCSLLGMSWHWWRECDRRATAEEFAGRCRAAFRESDAEANALRGEKQEWLRKEAALTEELLAAISARDGYKRAREAAEADRDRLAAELEAVASVRDHHGHSAAGLRERVEALEAELARRDKVLHAVARALGPTGPGAVAKAQEGGTDDDCPGKGDPAPPPALALVALPLWHQGPAARCWRPA
jgi:hypothetical protein